MKKIIEPATEDQREKARLLCLKLPKVCSKEDADKMIEERIRYLYFSVDNEFEAKHFYEEFPTFEGWREFMLKEVL